MKLYYSTFSIPRGEFSVAVTETGAVVATAFGGLEALQPRLRPGLPALIKDTKRTGEARRQLTSYFAGETAQFDLLLDASGTDFQHRVWHALREIPVGETRTYGQLAAQLGSPSASRAVGRANATNPICVIVPCHRVIGSNGSLTGFAFGTEWKQRLLDFERQLAGTVAS